MANDDALAPIINIGEWARRREAAELEYLETEVAVLNAQIRVLLKQVIDRVDDTVINRFVQVVREVEAERQGGQ
jgi:hypothetical protein